MADDAFNPPDAASGDLLTWVDDVADQFEAAWRSLTPPRLEDFLGETTGAWRAALLEELRKIDHAYRRMLALPPALAKGSEAMPRPLTPLPPVVGTGGPLLPDYEVQGEVGRGGMGVVYRARQKSLPRTVAIKMLLTGPGAGERQRQRFLAESRAVARLQHPNIVQIYEVGEHDGRPYFVFEFVEGGSLARRLAGAPQAPHVAAELVEKLARAMHYAHGQEIVHRDLKPSNVLLTGGPETPVGQCTPKITDFGLVKWLDVEPGVSIPGGPTLTGEILGTPSYMAPEQAEGKVREIGPATDVYALGAILYELLTGRPPFRGATTLDTLEQVRVQEPLPPSRVQPRTPRDLGTICLKALAKSQAHRYDGAGELADDLRRFLDGRPIHARPVGHGEKLWRWCRRNPLVASLTAGVALVLLAASGISLFLAVNWKEQEKQARFFAAEATEREKDARRHLYGAHLNLARQYWEGARVGQVRDLLQQHKPQANALDLAGWEWHYLWRLCHSELHYLPGHCDGVHRVAFSPDGRRLASAESDRRVLIWDTATGQMQYALEAQPAGVTSVAFSADGRWLAFGASEEGTVRVWDVARGQELHILRGHTEGVPSVAFSPDGRLASGDPEGRLLVWDATSGEVAYQRQAHARKVGSVAFSPDGRWLASSGEAQGRFGEVKLWEAASGRALRVLTDPTGPVGSVSFSPDGKQLAWGHSDGTVKLWDVPTGQGLDTLRGHTGPVSSVAFSPDGRWLASAGNDRTVKMWDVASRQEVQTFRGHSNAAMGVAFHPDGRLLASWGDDGIKLWDAAGGQEAHTRAGHHGVAFSPDGQWLAAPGPGSTVKVWDAASLQVLRILKGHTGEVWGVAFSPNGQRLASCGRDRTVRVWDWVNNNRPLHTLEGHTDLVFGVAFSREGQLLASCGRDGLVKVWDPATGQALHTFQHRQRPGTDQKIAAHSVAFSPADGRLLASASDDHTVQLWDAVNCRPLRTLEGHKKWVYGVAFSPDGKLLASASEDRTVKVWEVASGKMLGEFGHAEGVTSVRFHPGAQRLVSGTSLGGIKIWDMATRQELYTLKGHTKQVWGLEFSPDGWRLASASQDETVRVWDARPPDGLAAEREALGLVEFLFAKPLGKEEVIAGIHADQTISEEVRRQALAFAAGAREDPDRFDGASRAVVRRPGASAERYREALRWAETACRLEPGHWPYLSTLGMAQYRLEQYLEALATLTEADRINGRHFQGPIPADQAFLALIQHRQGQKEPAQATLKRLRAVMQNPKSKWHGDEEALSFWREAEALIAEDPRESGR